MAWREAFTQDEQTRILRERLRAEQIRTSALAAGLEQMAKAFVKSLLEKEAHINFDRAYIAATQKGSPFNSYYAAAKSAAGDYASEVDDKTGEHALEVAAWFARKEAHLKHALAEELSVIKSMLRPSSKESGKYRLS